MIEPVRRKKCLRQTVSAQFSARVVGCSWVIRRNGSSLAFSGIFAAKVFSRPNLKSISSSGVPLTSRTVHMSL